jgi:hypothetical protein
MRCSKPTGPAEIRVTTARALHRLQRRRVGLATTSRLSNPDSHIIPAPVTSSNQAIAKLSCHRDRRINRSFQCSRNFFGRKGLFGETLQSEFLDSRPFSFGGAACFINDMPLARCSVQRHLFSPSLASMLGTIRRLSDRRRRALRTRERLSLQDVKFPRRREKHKATAISNDETSRAIGSFYDVILGHFEACLWEFGSNVD